MEGGERDRDRLPMILRFLRRHGCAPRRGATLGHDEKDDCTSNSDVASKLT